MPTTFLDTGIDFAALSKGTVEEQLRKTQSALFTLQEQLRYILTNLTVNENFNSSDLPQTIREIEDGGTDVATRVELLESEAVVTNTRLTSAEGNITEIDAKADGLEVRIEGAEGDITEVDAKADGISIRTKTAQDTADAAQATAESIADGTYDGTFISGKILYSPDIRTSGRFSVVTGTDTSEIGGFRIYDRNQSMIFAVSPIQTGDEWYTRLSSASFFFFASDVYFSSSVKIDMSACEVDFVGSTVDFTNATITGLPAPVWG